MSLPNVNFHDTVRLVKSTGGEAERIGGATERSLYLTMVPPRQADAANLVYRRRRPLRFGLLGRGATVAAHWRLAGERDAEIEHYVVRIGIDDQIGELLLPAPVLNFALRELDRSLAIQTAGLQQAVFALELALSECLDALEARADCRLSLLSITPAGSGAARATESSLCFAIDIEELGRWDCALQIGAAQAGLLAQQLDDQAGIERAELADLPLPVCLRVAAASPTIRELRSVTRGDVILFDDACGRQPEAIAVVAEHLVATVAFDPNGARLSARPVRGRGSPWEWSMDKQDEATAVAEISDVDLDDMPVRVVFEVGRLELPLNEVRRLTVGTLIPFGRSVENAVEIVAHGRRMGRGMLVRIGDSLGVRVTRLFNHE